MTILKRGTSAFFALFFILNMSLVSSAHAHYSDVMCHFEITRLGDEHPIQMYSGGDTNWYKTDYANGDERTKGWVRVNWDNYTIIKNEREGIAIKVSKYGTKSVWYQWSSGGNWNRYWRLRATNIWWCDPDTGEVLD